MEFEKHINYKLPYPVNPTDEFLSNFRSHCVDVPKKGKGTMEDEEFKYTLEYECDCYDPGAWGQATIIRKEDGRKFVFGAADNKYKMRVDDFGSNEELMNYLRGKKTIIFWHKKTLHIDGKKYKLKNNRAETPVGTFYLTQENHDCDRPDFSSPCCCYEYVLRRGEETWEHGDEHCVTGNWSGSMCSYASTCGWRHPMKIELED